MAVTNAITDLVSSIFELFSSFLGAIYTIIYSFFAGVLGLFTGFFAFIADIFKGVFDVTSGVGKFVSSNVVILALIGAGVYAYSRFATPAQQRKG
ncbi:hypothetical protein QBC35DRAFT_354172, partial [Podospora australis]